MIHPHSDRCGLRSSGPTVRRLLRYVRPYGRHVAIVVAAVIGSSLLQLVPPYLTKTVIDRYVGAGDLNGLGGIAGVYALVLAGSFVLQCAHTWQLQMIGQRVMRDLRSDLFRHMQRLDLAFYDRHTVGGSMSRVTSDVDALNELFTAGVVTILSDVVMLSGILIVLLWMDWRLALVAVSGLPIVAVSVHWFRRRARESNRSARAWLGRINGFLQERISGMSTVQLCRAEACDLERFDAINGAYRDETVGSHFYYRVLYSSIEVVAALTATACLWIGGGLVLRDAMMLGSLVAFLQYMQRFFRPIGDLAEKFGVVQGVIAPLERIFTVLDTPVATRSAAAPVQLRPGTIRFERVTFAYVPGRPVLNDVSFEVGPGQRIGIVGATGAGKSTIVNLLMRFYDVQQGRITIDGIDIRRCDLSELRAQFGLVLQDVHLFADTIAANVRLGDHRISDAAIRSALDAVSAGAIVDRLPGGLSSMVAERAATLSVGEKQLLSCARALAMDPPVLVLDEATSSVDTATESLVRDALRVLMSGRTTIAIAHRLSTIHDMDSILVLHKGVLREAGTHRSLLERRGIYYRLHQVQLAPTAAVCRTTSSLPIS